jgi:type II secretory pathway pseudopilin PulG
MGSKMNENGFTLIELVITAGILVIGLVGMAVLMISSMNINKTSRQMAVATTLAHSKMETIRQIAYLGLGERAIEDYNTIPDYPSFKRVVAVSPLSDGTDAKSVTVTVSWKDRIIHSVELKTMLKP